MTRYFTKDIYEGYLAGLVSGACDFDLGVVSSSPKLGVAITKEINELKKKEDIPNKYMESIYKMPNKYMKRCSISLVIRKMHIKIILLCTHKSD